MRWVSYSQCIQRKAGLEYQKKANKKKKGGKKRENAEEMKKQKTAPDSHVYVKGRTLVFLLHIFFYILFSQFTIPHSSFLFKNPTFFTFLLSSKKA